MEARERRLGNTRLADQMAQQMLKIAKNANRLSDLGEITAGNSADQPVELD